MRKLFLHLLFASSFFAPLAARPAKANSLSDAELFVIRAGTSVCYGARRGLSTRGALNVLYTDYSPLTVTTRLDDPFIFRRVIGYAARLNSRCEATDFGINDFLRTFGRF